ncbi:MAG: molybdopterin molybdotransferase MoeA, partial [Candidatus Bathyarchaeota archaeon]
MTKMRPFKRLISRLEALELIKNHIKPIKRVEQVPLEEAASRVLASDAVAGFNVPPFDRSSMDGYAVKAEDTYGASTFDPKRLKLIGVQHAGEFFEGVVRKGESVEVATGSPVPTGSDAVVMVEYTHLKGDMVEIQKPEHPGANISPEGEDIKAGEVVVSAEDALTPAKIGALAALNMISVEVYEKPRVAIFSTGSEVRPLGTKLEPGQIYDINSYTLASVVSANGCIPLSKEIVPDERGAIETAVREASTHDLGVFSGGSSVGTRDLFATVI